MLVRIGLAGSILDAVVLWIVGYAIMERAMSIPNMRTSVGPSAARFGKVRHSHFWHQRLTALATCRSHRFIAILMPVGRPMPAVVQILGSPLVRDRDAAVHRLGPIT